MSMPAVMGNRCPEARQVSSRAPKRERDDQRLDALVAGGCADPAAQRVEVAAGEPFSGEPADLQR
jgi:hypothetical protein